MASVEMGSGASDAHSVPGIAEIKETIPAAQTVALDSALDRGFGEVSKDPGWELDVAVGAGQFQDVAGGGAGGLGLQADQRQQEQQTRQ